MMKQQSAYILTNAVRTCFRKQTQNKSILRNYRNLFVMQVTTATTITTKATAQDPQNCKQYHEHQLLTTNFRTQQLQRAQYSKFGSINEKKICDIVWNLTESERAALRDALHNYESCQLKKELEGQLAAMQWRSRFGRPSRVLPTLGDVDPTGTFCAFPENWLKNKLAEKVPLPSAKDRFKIFLVNAVPFLVFGFLDNFTMIVAGDTIEKTLGLYMSITTLGAAGLGNTLSDILGLGSAVYVERGCELIGLRPPNLTPAQFDLKACRSASNLGRIIGITVGCFIGMFPLLFKEPSIDDIENKN